MARRVGVPSVEQAVPGTQAALKRVTSTRRTATTDTSPGTVTPNRRPISRATARRPVANIDEAIALLDARDGYDYGLLPYQPTPSINPPRPRTLAAGYDKDSRTLRVRFRDGTPWEYYDVPPDVWRRFQRVKSPGRFINRVLNDYEYARGNF